MNKLLFLGPAVALLALGAYACSDDSTAAAPAADYTPMLTSVAQNLIVPGNADFVAKAEAFAAAGRDLEATTTADTYARAQAAWQAARTSWRKLDAFQFGPMNDLGLPQQIGVEPAIPADMEKFLTGTRPVDASAVASLGGQNKGFLGTEQLLFKTPLADLTGDGIAARRRALLRYAAEEIAQAAHRLEDAWSATGGNYVNTFATAGKGSARYPSQRAALDELVGGVAFALEYVVGIRLAMPLGRKTSGTPDPSLDYTAASDSTAADIAASLAGIDEVYAQDLSGRIANTVLSGRMTSQLRDCATQVAGLSRPFTTAVTGQTTVVQAAYDACKVAKGTWNTDVTSALGATLRPTDNDGD